MTFRDVNDPFISSKPFALSSLLGEATLQRIPLSFDLEITARCNNNCRHCYINLPAGDATAKSAELSLEEITRLAEQAVSMGALWCLITGGEPLLRPDFDDLYLALKRLGLLVSVFTNACLITGRHVDLFKRYPPRHIEVTVYGVTQATYESVTRRRGSFAAFERGLSLLLDGGIPVNLKAMALRSNVHELPAIAEFCRTHSKDSFRFDPLLHLRYDGNALRNATIRSERLSPGEIVTLEQADEKRLSAVKKACAAEGRSDISTPKGNRLFHCDAGNYSFSVSFDGRLRLCGSLHASHLMYDLRSGTLCEAWQQFIPAVRKIQSSNEEFLRYCHSCRLASLSLCCPAHAFLEAGEMDARIEYFCEVAHARAAAVSNSNDSSNPEYTQYSNLSGQNSRTVA